MKKVLIAVPSTFVMWSHVTTDLINLAVFSSKDFELGYVNIQSALLPVSRDDLVLYARQLGFDYILFVDSDMKFPPNGLIRLFNHHKAIVGVNAAVKGEDRPVIEKDINGQDILSMDAPLAEVEGIGMAFTLINMKVFEGMKQPFFYIDYGYDQEDNFHHWGEDKSFCRDVRERGIKSYCDNLLSQEIEHLGEKAYKLSDFQ